MVGLVLVSHSKQLAEAVRELVLQMTAPDFPVAVAAGVGDDHDQLGTDAVLISEVLARLRRPEGVLVLMDLGSAVLSAQTALELLEPSPGNPVELCSAPIVEGAIAAAVQSFAGGTLQEVCLEAQRGLAAKQEQLGPPAVLTTAPEEVPAPGPASELVLVVNNEHGLHARPAACLVRTASQYNSAVEVFNISGDRGPASARSLTSVALLQIHQGDRIRIVVTGADREAVLQAIEKLTLANFDEPANQPAAPSTANLPPRPARPHDCSGGVPASEGIAIGPLAELEDAAFALDDSTPSDPPSELAKLTAAVSRVQQRIQQQIQRRSQGLSATNVAAEIMEAQSLILNDPALVEKLQTLVHHDRLSAVRAWSQATEELVSQYRGMDDAYFRERATDVRDIARSVLAELGGGATPKHISPDLPSILFTRELLPSEAAACDALKVLGVIAREGSAASHSAILLRTLGIPMIVGVDWPDDSLPLGKTVALDGSTGEVWIEPNTETATVLQGRQQGRAELRRQAVAAASQPSCTLDGACIEVLANVSSVADANAAIASGAEGIGLLRTEFLFLSRETAPSEEQQVAALREILAVTKGPAIVRTLDAGADKPLPFLPQAPERNPFLGARGIRLALRHEAFFLAHLRAILVAGFGHELWVMFPMISVPHEAEQARRLLEQAHLQLERGGQAHAWPVKVGAMIEVPSAALISDQLAAQLDFFSIGTNDLTQYVMAAERGSASTAELQDALHPAILRLMKQVIDGAATRQRHVSICGDAASDPLAAAVYVGMGIHSLSARPNQVAEIKALFRGLMSTELMRLGECARQCRDAAEVRRLAKRCIESATVRGHVETGQ